MPLVDRVTTRPHTVRAFRAAAGARFREGVKLAVADRPLGAVYLFGYAAEMLLKAAYFRLAEWAANEEIALDHVGDARRHAVQNLEVRWAGNLHDLGAWAELLIRDRTRRGQPYPRPFSRRLRARVSRLYANWRESLRYHDARPFAGELASIRESAAWLLTRFQDL